MEKSDLLISSLYHAPFHLFNESLLLLKNAGYDKFNIKYIYPNPLKDEFPSVIDNNKQPATYKLELSSGLWLLNTNLIDELVNLNANTVEPDTFPQDLPYYFRLALPNHNKPDIVLGVESDLNLQVTYTKNWIHFFKLFAFYKYIIYDKLPDDSDGNRIRAAILESTLSDTKYQSKLAKIQNHLGGQDACHQVLLSLLKRIQ